MRRTHPPLTLAAAVTVLALAAVPAAAQPLVFPPTPVGGESEKECFFVCILTNPAPGDGCDSASNQGGTIDSLFTNIPFSVENLRRGQALTGSTNPCLAGNTNPMSLPVNLNPGQVLYSDLFFRPTAPGDYFETLGFTGRKGNQTFSASVAVQGMATGGDPTAPCIDDADTLCLRDDRFKVEVDWRTNFGTSGSGLVVPFQTNDSGLFYFFNSNNWEMVIKVINACTPEFNRFWVFAGGLTNVETTITVTDTQHGAVKQYRNPLNTPFQPIQDTSAFATCP